MTQERMDEVANLWHKTKDPKYKELWYKLIKEFANGANNIKRRPVSIETGNKKEVRGGGDNTRN